VPAEKLGRLPTYRGADCAPIDERLWTEPPIFPSGSGRLVSTLSDLHRFRRMLLASGDALLSHESVRLVTTDHLTQAQRDASTLFLEGAGWGFGGAVGADGRYGWIGGTARPRSRAIDTDPRRRALAFERGAQNVRPSPALR
jgi:CubicO group peptidase (beta-lactamase class C family)